MLPEVRTSGRMAMGLGDTTTGAVDKVGRLAAAGIAFDEGTLGICSTEAEVRTGRSRPHEAETGTEASRLEAGADMLSEAVV